MEKPALHVVVHHRFDPEKPYENVWDDDCVLLRQFETTAEVAGECQQARREEAWVYVHRCGLPPIRPTIACRGRVVDIKSAAGKRPHIVLDDVEVIDKRARQKPAEGHNHYYSDLPSWSD
jgi:hypothetical protein